MKDHHQAGNIIQTLGKKLTHNTMKRDDTSGKNESKRRKNASMSIGMKTCESKRELAAHLTYVGHHCIHATDTTKYNSSQTFHYECDSAPDTLLSISHYVVDSDVLIIAEEIYSTFATTDLATDDDTVASFFGSDQESIARGKQLFLQQDADDSTSAASNNIA